MNKLVTLSELNYETGMSKQILLHHLPWFEVEGVLFTLQAHVDAMRIEDEQIKRDYRDLCRSNFAAWRAE